MKKNFLTEIAIGVVAGFITNLVWAITNLRFNILEISIIFIFTLLSSIILNKLYTKIRFKIKRKKYLIIILEKANKAEIENAIDVANKTQESFRFEFQNKIIELNTKKYLLPNGGYDIDNAIDYMVNELKFFNSLFNKNPILITSLPYSDKNLVEEYKDKILIDELSQCYFYNINNYDKGNLALISTYIWDNLPENPDIKIPMSTSGRRVLQPFLLFVFSMIVLDTFGDLPFHEETKGCPFDYCNNVYEIDKAFETKSICQEHMEILQSKKSKSGLTKKQIASAKKLLERAWSDNNSG